MFTAFIVQFQTVNCHSSYTFSTLIERLRHYRGFCFLQDDGHPFFAILPKRLLCASTQICQIRQADLSYLDQPLRDADLHTFVIFTANTPPTASPLRFRGGYICFFSYDFVSTQQLSHIDCSNHNRPTALIGEYDIFIQKIDGQWTLCFDTSLDDCEILQTLIFDLQQPASTQENIPFQLKHPVQARWTKSDYTNAFEQVQDYLHAGDCYQINLTQEFQSVVQSGRLHQLLPELLELSQAPFAGYIAFEDFELLSCSPELFIEFQADRLIRTRPIKGTLPRDKDVEIDQANRQRLATSEKDQAENLMIVDLLRNDLSVFAETGSVKTPKLFEVESFAQVHHLVSEIQARLKPEINPLEMLLQALPGGSITGAPKIRAMQIIDELEGNPRGAYCGSLGYFNYDGTGRFNILIRSLQRYGNTLSIWAGGGITVASNVDAEYQECLDKVSALLDFLNQFADTSSI